MKTLPAILSFWALVTPVLVPSGHAAGTVFSSLLGGSGQDYATAVTSDSQGNTYVAGLTYSPDFPVTKGAVQTSIGALYYPDAFVAKLGPAGNVLWATYLGGQIDDWATGIALDGAGNVWVTGYTRAAEFPVTANALEGALDNGSGAAYFNVFVAEIDPSGSKLLYSTFLGAQSDAGGAAIAIDAGNNVYLAANVNSPVGFPGIQGGTAQSGIVVSKLTSKGALVYSFFHPGGNAYSLALDSAGEVYVAGSLAPPLSGIPQAGLAMVFKVSADGTKQIYEKDFGGSYWSSANAIAVDSAEEAWVGGSTGSADFPLVHPLQSTLGARPIWQSTNNGATWTPIDNLPFAIPEALVVDPTTPATLYEATGDLGVFKSTNGGATWTQSSNGIAGSSVTVLTIDPVHPQTLYAATAANVYKSTDGAGSWKVIDTLTAPVRSIQVDGQNPNIVYQVSSSIRKSTDGGNTWAAVAFPAVLASMVVDPQASGHLLATSQLVYCGSMCGTSQNPYIFTSTDGGATWTQLLSPTPPSSMPLLVDPSTKPSTVYDGLQYSSADGGMTWTSLPAPPFSLQNLSSLGLDAAGNLYAAVLRGPMYVSRDHGHSWTATGAPTPIWTGSQGGPSVIGIVLAGSTGVLYDTVSSRGSAGFVTKLSADGSTLAYSSYLRGHTQLEPGYDFASEPGVELLDNWVSGIALDAAGNVVLAGGTTALDFPAASPVQAANAGSTDAFAAVLSADGSKVLFSTYYGGSQTDGALAAALDAQGNVLLVGQTWSGDFPPAGVSSPSGFGEAFAVKLSVGPPTIGSVLNAASYQAGIEAGSWAMIKGANLANSTRLWKGSDFSGNNLPAQLDGVSVTIDGKPAFVEYISPEQVNVQVPSDSTTGPVSVVVNNNGTLSNTMQAMLQPVAPAFFVYLGSNAVATTLGYTLIGDPSAVPGAVAAHPGDAIVLWGTGFGATTPAVAAGTIVSGAPLTAVLPAITVSGAPAQVISATLAAGSVGLYQVTIRVPDGAPAGADAVQASVNGVPSATGVTIFVKNP